ncbi:DNA polymerase II large subunit [Candidatus Woesearchaeota archaeon]|jgi:DNA polymerase II large subunit|nr:DNA polymerase II large subunit [Candidatus Woesearchaeota archaeon]MBT5271951.1 DNA polymerase II large subunit [Candidatus Woesearchaeota archaeon]MBT6041063.1 DNA polymerase II large subunit [Candidatus Woesearchaeota archaeon]MBT6336239.1 DNA polymerase II large subunit [Candidatus Woesearchaeota archaeon]MBT7927994.1 DNA polymerase II large subunit [Candidatus Woesearchaeota archaeon]
MVVKSKEMEKYFETLEVGLNQCYDLANKARALNLDPESKVDIKLARNMAERVEALIGIVAPQMVGCGVIKHIIELEKKYGHMDWRVALSIALAVAKQKFCKFETQKEAIEVGIRTGFAYQTGGIVAAPLEGFIELKIKKTALGKEYLAPCYAGPIRGAGGTASAFSLILVDYLRTQLGFEKYDPTPVEINRFKAEVADYHDRITNLQYLPSSEEIEFLVKHLPIEVEGDPTEKIEVSNYKDLQRIETNRIRGGLCLVLAEGLAQKAPKLWKRLEKWGKEFNLEWGFLEEFLKLQKSIKARTAVGGGSKEKISPNYTFIADLVAGRPVLTHPMAKGGFRLRYGRSRMSGFSASSINPALMLLLKKYIGVGTQLKIERPGKAAAITSCDSINGPIIKLKDGSVIKVDTIEEAKKYVSSVDQILFMGDFLVNYGDFSENGHALVPCGYNEEWWIRDLEKQSVEKFGTIDVYKLATTIDTDPEKLEVLLKEPLFTKISAKLAIQISQKLMIPLHPNYTFHWDLLENQDLRQLIDFWPTRKVVEEEGKLKKIVLKNSSPIKEILEQIGCPHNLVNNEFIILERHYAEIFEFLLKNPAELKINEEKTALENLMVFSGIKIKNKSGTFIGARMGRPEKAKMRKMTGSPQVLFPVGDEGGRTRSFQSALTQSKVTADFPLFFCSKCEKESVYKSCELCGQATKQQYFCRQCGKTDKQKCPNCKEDLKQTHERKELDIKHYFNSALKIFKEPTYPDLIKGVRGTSNKNHIPEHLVKGILRAKHGLFVNKDGTMRYDMSELPITHFKPCEVGTAIEKLKELGYQNDVLGKELESSDQILEIKPQDVILPGAYEALDEPAKDVLFRAANFIDELLIKLYSLKPYYNLKSPLDLVGHLIIGLAPHISAGTVGRIIGFSKTQGLLAHPLFHAAMRRDCDGDEASATLLLDGFLNFSSQYLPDTRGAKTMDAPLVLTITINPTEVDDQAHGLDVVWQYPLELYEAAEQYKNPWDVKIEQITHRLGKETQYEQMGFTHPTTNINEGVLCSAYKTLPSMKEKLQGQMDIARRIKAVDETNVAEMVITKHFLKDTKGNLRKFSQQQFRCVKCNEKFRRPPLRGYCVKCGGKIIFTISEGNVTKYMQLSLNLAKEFGVSTNVQQTLELLQNRINGVFGKETEKQEALGKWV